MATRKAAAAAVAPTLNLREEQKLFTRHKLLDAALAVFSEKGFAETSIDEITERSGASRATFYLHFKNKLEIVQELFKPFSEEWDVLTADLGRLSDEGRTSRRDLEQWIDAFVRLYSKYRLVLQAYYQAEQSDHAPTEPTRDRLLVEVTKFVAAARRGGARHDPQSDQVRALLMMVQLERFCYFWLIRSWKADHKVVVSTIADVWYVTAHGYGG